MRMRWLILTTVVFAAITASGAAQDGTQDGRLIASAACHPKKLEYEKWLHLQEQGYAAEVEFGKMHGVDLRPFADLRPALPSADEFHRRRAYDGFICERLTYASDGLKVVAYVWRPKNTEGKRLPLIIFNRGGGQDLGKLVPWEHDGFIDFLQSGFAVIGSQYRGNDGGEGHDEEGGTEVRDIVNLLPLARSLGYLDMRNVFMMGDSRGAMMTYLAMQAGVEVKAAAVVGGETDLAANLKRRPELLEGYRKDIPGFGSHPAATLRARSAIDWADSVSAPVLMMHGGKDWRVPPTQDLAFAAKLEALRKPYELVVFDGDTHLLSFHWRERDRRTIEWFVRHMVEAGSRPAPGPNWPRSPAPER